MRCDLFVVAWLRKKDCHQFCFKDKKKHLKILFFRNSKVYSNQSNTQDIKLDDDNDDGNVP